MAQRPASLGDSLNDGYKTLHIVLFSFMNFCHQVFSYKVFNETMIDANICLISYFFPTGIFLEIKQGMDYSLNLAGSW
jgi:hypothetical protein